MGVRMKTFIKKYSSRLYKIAFVILRDEKLAEEVVQEVMSSKIETLLKHHQIQDFERTLAAIVTRKAIEKKRELKKVSAPIECPIENRRNRKFSEAKLLKVVYK